MITFTNLNRNFKPDDFDECWMAVRSLKEKSPWMTHVPELSPSWDLFKKYLSLRDAGKWNPGTFESVYRPQFLREMQGAAARAKLGELAARSNAGRRIAVLCFCKDARTCHRSILAELVGQPGDNAA